MLTTKLGKNECRLDDLSDAEKCRAMKAIVKGKAEYYEIHETVINASPSASVGWMHSETGVIRKK